MKIQSSNFKDQEIHIPTSFWVGKDSKDDRMPIYLVYLHQRDGAPKPGPEHDDRRHRREAEQRRPFLQQRRLPSPPRGAPLTGRGHSADFHSQSYNRLILLSGYPLSILYQDDFTLQIFTINPISGCFHSTDIPPYIRLLLLFGSPLSVLSYIRLILLCGYQLSILYRVDFTLRISTLMILCRVDFTLRITTLNPISG